VATYSNKDKLMPRNIIPIEVKRLRGNPGRRPLHSGPQPARTDPPEPLAFLSEDAKAEWRRLAPELHRLGLLTLLDHSAFGAYCSSFARWMAADRMLESEGLLAPGSTGNMVVHPAFKIAVQCARDLIRIGNEFGLTPCGRTRIAAGGYMPPEPPSKFGDLLA
jgi:P27 family predicted phage terminase small subunit